MDYSLVIVWAFVSWGLVRSLHLWGLSPPLEELPLLGSSEERQAQVCLKLPTQLKYNNNESVKTTTMKMTLQGSDKLKEKLR